MYDELGDSEKVITHRIRLHRLRNEYDQLANEANLKNQMYRTHVPGYNNIKSEKVIKNKTFEVFDSIKSADSFYRPQIIEYWKQWTSAEKYASYEYTAGSGSFNNPLRNDGIISEKIKDVMSALNKCSLEKIQ